MPALPAGGAAPPGATAFLALDKLTKRFGDQVAVDGLSLSVAQGEFISLLGPSGCGKTTTLQMIAGFVEASSGAVVLEGRDLLAIRPSERGSASSSRATPCFRTSPRPRTSPSAWRCARCRRASAPRG